MMTIFSFCATYLDNLTPFDWTAPIIRSLIIRDKLFLFESFISQIHVIYDLYFRLIGEILSEKCLNLKLSHPSSTSRRSIFTDTKLGTIIKTASTQLFLVDRPLDFTSIMEMITLNKAGEAAGQTIECMDGSFDVHEWCLYQSNILFSFFEGKTF